MTSPTHLAVRSPNGLHGKIEVSLGAFRSRLWRAAAWRGECFGLFGVGSNRGEKLPTARIANRGLWRH